MVIIDEGWLCLLCWARLLPASPVLGFFPIFLGWATLSIWLYTQPFAWEICTQTLGHFRHRRYARDIQGSHNPLLHFYIFYFQFFFFTHRIIRTNSFIGMATKTVSIGRCQLSMGPQARACYVQPTHCSLKRHALPAAAAAAATHGNSTHTAKSGWPHYAYATNG